MRMSKDCSGLPFAAFRFSIWRRTTGKLRVWAAIYGKWTEIYRQLCLTRSAICAAFCANTGPITRAGHELATFGEISERELTANELTINYDREKGYIGHKIAGEPLISCSPLDRLLLVWKDGRCKVVLRRKSCL